MDNMTKVLVVTEQYWPEGGGGILATHLITKVLAQHGLQVTVATGTDQPSRIEGVEYFTIPHLKARNKVNLWLNLVLLERTSLFKKMLEDTDIVYVPRYCYPIIPLAKLFGKRVIAHLHDYQPIAHNATILHPHQNSHGSNPLNPIKKNIKYELMEHRSLSRAVASTLLLPSNALTRHWLKEADEVICVSKKQAEIISGKLNINVEVIYNPLPETPTVTKQVEAPSFLYTGGTSYIKGIHILLEASKRLLRRNGAAKFVVTKGFQTTWQRVLTDNLAAAYQILGWVGYEELHRLHSSTLALIFPSIWQEPLPYTVSEAMLHGTIPIASKVGGVPEIVQGSPAEKMLFQPGDVEELVDKMEATLTLSNEQIIEVGYDLRENILKRFDPEITQNKLTELFLPYGQER